jgi:hypothetical protein
MPSRRLSIGLLFLSVAVYIAALLQDEVFCVSGNCGDWPGYAILLFGVLAVGGNLANMAWLANPLLLATWLTTWFGRRTPSVIVGLAALVLAASFLFAGTVVSNEAGIANPITGLRLGYWLWLASAAIACTAAMLAAPSNPATI